jgi:hypothetical protein
MTMVGFNDANFYELVHQLVGPRESASTNRRNAPRHGFPGKHRVAPYRGGPTPLDDAFREVVCQDISTGGFSFYCREVPSTPKLAVHLSNEAVSLWLIAEICHSSPVDGDDGPMLLVGCRFVGRLEPVAA